MQIQTNTDNTIERHEPLTRHVESVVKEALSRFSKQITRVVVHLSDTNDYKSSNGDHRCMMEARIEGHPPIAASDHGASLHQAIHGAAEKLKRSIDSTLGRISDGAKDSGIVAEDVLKENEDL
jgi:ribosome-associated translation inhibitor RaiA